MSEHHNYLYQNVIDMYVCSIMVGSLACVVPGSSYQYLLCYDCEHKNIVYRLHDQAENE